jgi:hypothetical protein
MRSLVSAALGLALLVACGGDGEPAETGSAEGSPEAAEETAGETGGDAEGAGEVEEVVLYPEGTLDPNAVTAETVVAASALNEAYFAWDSVEVTVAGYPYIFYGDSTTIEEEIALTESPESEEELVTVLFSSPPGVTVAGDEIVAARGVGVRSWTGGVEVGEAELVAPPETLTEVETSPYAYDGTVIPAAQLVDLYGAWEGREVAVSGHYHSTTTSTTDYGTTIRVDLSSPEDTYTKYAGCEMAAEIPAETESLMLADRDAVVIRGTVAGESFGRISLEGCEVVRP